MVEKTDLGDRLAQPVGLFVDGLVDGHLSGGSIQPSGPSPGTIA
jgi:hypothetical protein